MKTFNLYDYRVATKVTENGQKNLSEILERMESIAAEVKPGNTSQGIQCLTLVVKNIEDGVGQNACSVKPMT